MKFEPDSKRELPPACLEENDKVMQQSCRKKSVATAITTDQSCKDHKSAPCGDPSISDENHCNQKNPCNKLDQVLLTEKQKIENKKADIRRMRKKTGKLKDTLKVDLKRNLKSKTKRAQKELEEKQKLQALNLLNVTRARTAALSAERKLGFEMFESNLRRIEKLAEKNEIELENRRKTNMEEVDTRRQLLLQMGAAKNSALVERAAALKDARLRLDERDAAFTFHPDLIKRRGDKRERRPKIGATAGLFKQNFFLKLKTGKARKNHNDGQEEAAQTRLAGGGAPCPDGAVRETPTPPSVSAGFEIKNGLLFDAELAEIERLRKKNEAEIAEAKKKNMEEIENLRRLMQEVEEAQNAQFALQAKNLEDARRKLHEERRMFGIAQQREQQAVGGAKKEIGLSDLLAEIDGKDDATEEVQRQPSPEAPGADPSGAADGQHHSLYDFHKLFGACNRDMDQRDPGHEVSRDVAEDRDVAENRDVTEDREKSGLDETATNTNYHIFVSGETSSITGIGGYGYDPAESSGFLSDRYEPIGKSSISRAVVITPANTCSGGSLKEEKKEETVVPSSSPTGVSAARCEPSTGRNSSSGGVSGHRDQDGNKNADSRRYRPPRGTQKTKLPRNEEKHLVLV